MGDSDGLVRPAQRPHALWPEGQGQVRPVVPACFERVPTLGELFLPGLVAKQAPQRRGGDQHAVVLVRLVGQACDPQQLLAQRLDLALSLQQGIGTLASLGVQIAVAPQALQVGPDLLELGVDVVVDAGVEGLIGQARVVDPECVGTGLG